MASMEQFKEMATDAAKSAAKTAKYLALVSKKRVAIASEQEKIRRSYTKLGKVYYKDYVTDEEPDEAEYTPLCETISESYRRINLLREELAQAKEDFYAEGGTPEEAEQAEENAEPLALTQPDE